MRNAFFAALALALATSACGGGPTANQSSEPTVEAAAPPVALGSTGKATGIDFTVTDVSTPKQIGPAGVGLKAEPGETFVVVAYTLKNTGDANLPLMDRPGMTLVDPSGRSYEPDQMAGPMAGGMMDDVSGMAADLNPNVSAKTKTAWKVDAKAFDAATWRLVVASDPRLTFALK